MPDHGVASWVSANDKPITATGTKPVSGDAAEQRLKAEVMSLPNRDRRRLKDVALNDVSTSVTVGIWNLYVSISCFHFFFFPNNVSHNLYSNHGSHLSRSM